MTVHPGESLGPYTLVSVLGRGGMGEVWLADDTRLSRRVAIKLLPPEIAEDADRRARFEREAQVLSQLQHPNVCTLHDVGEHEGRRFLVMERLEGETLSERLERGALTRDELLRAGAQIADGLEAAHRKGLVHRDLKPGNVMLTPTGAKILDLGLARIDPSAPFASLHGTGNSADPEAETRSAEPLSAEGLVAGTVPYMSPEQVEGKQADHRSDIFALGALLLEMATGQRAFEGESAAATVSAILQTPPESVRSSSDVELAPALARLVRRCLQRDPEHRFQSARDLSLELRELQQGSESEASGASSAPGVPAWAWAVAAIALVVVATGAYLAGRGSSNLGSTAVSTGSSLSEAAVEEFVIDTPFASVESVALAPDGQELWFVASPQGDRRRLYRRSFSSREIVEVPDTEDAYGVRFSERDGSVLLQTYESISTASGVGGVGVGRLLRLDPETGDPIETLAQRTYIGGAYEDASGDRFEWDLESVPSGLVQRSPGGAVSRVGDDVGSVYGVGTDWLLLQKGAPRRYSDLILRWLDDGSEIVISSVQGQSAEARIAPEGVVLFHRDGGLWGKRVDLEQRRVGAGVELLDDLATFNMPTRVPGGFDLAPDGTLAYAAGTGSGELTELVVVTRSGEATAVPNQPRHQFECALASPDGKEVSLQEVTQGPDGRSRARPWLYSFETERWRQPLLAGTHNSFLVWSRDGQHVLFLSDRNSVRPRELFVARRERLSEARAVTPGGDGFSRWNFATYFPPEAIVFQESSPDRAETAIVRVDLDTLERVVLDQSLPLTAQTLFHPSLRWILAGGLGRGLWLLPADGSKPPVALTALGSDAQEGIFSWQGDELFYRATGKVMRVDLDPETGSLGDPEEMFDDVFARIQTRGFLNWSVLPDGRFVMLRSAEQRDTAEIVVIKNFHKVLEEKVPPIE